MITENNLIALGVPEWSGRNGQKRYYIKRLWDWAGLTKRDDVYYLGDEVLDSKDGAKLLKALQDSSLYFDSKKADFNHSINSYDRFTSSILLAIIMGNLERAIADMPRFEFEA